MPGASGHPIVETAIQLLMELPNEPALSLLDRAMRGHECSHPDFDSCDLPSCRYPHPAYADELDWPSPFAELLRRALAPQLDPRELVLLALQDDATTDAVLQARIASAGEAWQRVIDLFAARYRLWSD